MSNFSSKNPRKTHLFSIISYLSPSKQNKLRKKEEKQIGPRLFVQNNDFFFIADKIL